MNPRDHGAAQKKRYPPAGGVLLLQVQSRKEIKNISITATKSCENDTGCIVSVPERFHDNVDDFSSKVPPPTPRPAPPPYTAGMRRRTQSGRPSKLTWCNRCKFPRLTASLYVSMESSTLHTCKHCLGEHRGRPGPSSHHTCPARS